MYNMNFLLLHLFNKAAIINWLIVAALFINLNSYAQSDVLSSETKNDSEAFSFRSASIIFGIYNPSMDYWKEESFFKDGSYKPSLFIGANADYSVTNWLCLRLGLGFWRQETQSDFIDIGEVKMELNAIPVSPEIIVFFKKQKFGVFTPFIGAGANFLFLKNKLTFPKTFDEQLGSTVTGHGIAGIEGRISDNFIVSGEFQYHIGNYTQQFYTDETFTVTTDETISLSGPKFNLSLKYLF